MQNKISSNIISKYIYKSLQYISYCHSKNFIQSMIEAYEKETGIAAKNAIKQILINSRMCVIAKRPLCQDTGIVNVFVEVGMNVNWDGDFDFDDAINLGIKEAYTDKNNPLRASIVDNPLFARNNTQDNTPGVINYQFVKGNKVKFSIASKGCGSENKAKFSVLGPSDSLTDWVMKQIPSMGAGWCPPGIIGIGVGGTAEKAMLMAKQALLEKIDIAEIKQKKQLNGIEKLRIALVDKINNLGIGAQGLGGLTTVLDVKIKDYPTHAASLPVALIANCAATRHIDITIGDDFPEPDLSIYPDFSMDYADYKKVDLSNLTKEKMQHWKIGDNLLLSGVVYTARDAAHKRLQSMIKSNKKLPVDFTNKFIYYVGPVDAVGDEIIGPAGPTTATRMDKFTEDILSTGCLGAIGKAERSLDTVVKFNKQKCIYLIAVGGAAYLISKTIKKSEVVAFPELGMEAIYRLEVENMPVSVAIDSLGNNIHQKISF